MIKGILSSDLGILSSFGIRHSSFTRSVSCQVTLGDLTPGKIRDGMGGNALGKDWKWPDSQYRDSDLFLGSQDYDDD